MQQITFHFVVRDVHAIGTFINEHCDWSVRSSIGHVPDHFFHALTLGTPRRKLAPRNLLRNSSQVVEYENEISKEGFAVFVGRFAHIN